MNYSKRQRGGNANLPNVSEAWAFYKYDTAQHKRSRGKPEKSNAVASLNTVVPRPHACITPNAIAASIPTARDDCTNDPTPQWVKFALGSVDPYPPPPASPEKLLTVLLATTTR